MKKCSYKAVQLGLKRGIFTGVRWLQVTLHDPIWKVTLCSSEMNYH